jgi:hypothetical protein
MTLREVTHTVLSVVENVSGCPVVVSEDASLKTLAASRIARGANRFQAISSNASAGIAQNLFVNRSEIKVREELLEKILERTAATQVHLAT